MVLIWYFRMLMKSPHNLSLESIAKLNDPYILQGLHDEYTQGRARFDFNSKTRILPLYACYTCMG